MRVVFAFQISKETFPDPLKYTLSTANSEVYGILYTSAKAHRIILQPHVKDEKFQIKFFPKTDKKTYCQ